MKDFEIIKNNELNELLDDPELEELFENGDIIEEFKVESELKEKTEYDPALKIY